MTSDAPIKVLATFKPLNCIGTGSVLSADTSHKRLIDFPNAERMGTRCPSALGNKLAAVAIIANPNSFESADIVSFFNSNPGKPGCLEGATIYFGADGKANDGEIESALPHLA